jgi:hypothetical protein
MKNKFLIKKINLNFKRYTSIWKMAKCNSLKNLWKNQKNNIFLKLKIWLNCKKKIQKQKWHYLQNLKAHYNHNNLKLREIVLIIKIDISKIKNKEWNATLEELKIEHPRKIFLNRKIKIICKNQELLCFLLMIHKWNSIILEIYQIKK